MGRIMVPIKKSVLAKLVDNQTKLRSNILSAEKLSYIREETISNFKFLNDYVKNMIDRLERMENDPSTEYISNTCKDFEGISNIVERINTAFEHLAKHVSSQTEKDTDVKK